MATIYRFTNAGCSGRYGPSQQQLNNEYSGTTLSGLVTSVSGIQKFVVPHTGIYEITVAGASSGTVGSYYQGAIGYGAKLTYQFNLATGTVLYILVGQRPYPSSRSWQDGGMGGGGGTFIAIKDSNGSYSPVLNDYVSPLIIAGGAGGPRDNQGYSTGGHGSYNKGTDIRANSDSTTGGGGWTYDSWRSNSSSNDSYNAKSFLNGGIGGSGWDYVQGGFGGGGAPYDGGGGGGGYQGGNAYNNRAGAGGLSYARNDGVLITQSSGDNNSNGYAIITTVRLFSINATYDTGFTGVTFSPENYYITDKITVTPNLKPGYDWLKWTGDINSNTQALVINGLTKNISIHANSKPGRAEYKVQHWLMKIGGSGYDLEEAKTIASITGTIVSPDVKTFTGFQSPSRQNVTVKNDSTTVVNYYYTRNQYNIIVHNGTSSKYKYWYQETGKLIFDKTTTNASKIFSHWISDKPVTITNIFEKETQFVMPDYDISFSVALENNRLNSNIYKNIFPEDPFDLSYLQQMINVTPHNTKEIYQENHGLTKYMVVYKDGDTYKPAIATNSKEAFPVGIVSDVKENLFTLCDIGAIENTNTTEDANYKESTIMYLSDKQYGKMVPYDEIENNIYIPVAVYAHNLIVVNIQQGSIGATMVPYGEYQYPIFDSYTKADLDEIIGVIRDGNTTT